MKAELVAILHSRFTRRMASKDVPTATMAALPAGLSRAAKEEP